MTISSDPDRRVSFDFEIDFSNGGGIQGQGFRLDLHTPDITDRELADYIVQDLRLLMVKDVRILNKRILFERHKRSSAPAGATLTAPGRQFIDLSHTISAGMITYKGLPAPLICDFLSREASKPGYTEGTSFQIDKIEMVANTGTYLDSPFHRYENGCDLAGLELEQIAELNAVVVRLTGAESRAIDWQAFAATGVRDKAVLVHTDWAQYWGTAQYFEGHPYLTAAAATYLKDKGAKLVGIDSLNIDDTTDGTRPVHTILLGAGIPIIEHLRGLDQLPIAGFTFSAVPPKIRAMGAFPVRAYATLPSSPASRST